MKKFLYVIVFLLTWVSFDVYAVASQPVVATQGMVVSEQHLASQVGVDILRAGGNAVDAAVAVGYALAVVNPCCGNLGGGGFMTLHLASGKNIFINFRERAPVASQPNMFLDAHGKVIPNKSTHGYLAVAVPGTVLGLDTALKKYGTMTRQQVMQPALKLAAQGYTLTQGDVVLLDMYSDAFKTSPNVAAIFLNHGRSYQIGERLVQTNLANTLRLIIAKGPEVFYKGSIATAIVTASHAAGGILTLKDFSSYRVEELNPVTCTYHHYQIISAPPPSSGGVTLCEMLNILEIYPLKKMGFHTPESTYYLVEAMRLGFLDRNKFLGDPDFINNPVARLTSKNYAAHLRQSIPLTQPASSSPEGVNTTHYSVIDKWGNAAAVTVTLNSFFGADVIAGNTGFLLNNEMDDFAIAPNEPNQFGLIQGATNKIAPGKRPLSSMTPTIIMQGAHPVMVVGSPGGSRIITATLETILNVLDYDMNIQAAVDAPRFHYQGLPDAIDIEPGVFSAPALQALRQRGYHFTPVSNWGAVEAIYIDPATKKLYGGSDRRCGAGKAIGY